MTDHVDMRPSARVKRILDEAVGRDLTSTERHEFFPNIINKDFLSPAQEKWLSAIEKRIFNEGEKDA